MPPSTSRAIARFLISDVHDGRSMSFWFDNWSPLGPLINVFGTDGNRRLRVRLEASVADACTAHIWRLPHPRSDQEVSLHAFLTNFPLPAIDRGPDVFGWSTNGDINHSFSSGKTWEAPNPLSTCGLGNAAPISVLYLLFSTGNKGPLDALLPLC
ncbi:uncharacterized protein LOC125600459 [Brassica napus]|uniref:uncharacterized protein LOC106330994 n=1 Tax=Brassica oleracea var. oleracea TaxID=109376 RepID=UPI0006A6C75A|nr:PREDICTED: uncharacterized protein LOC106330994 [Brassica oleracea var. oleracea]XP_048629123.1 uncharacterized protein LOC125600459 [Brassica napus]